MEKLLNRLGIGSRLFAVALVPLVIAFGFAFAAALNANKTSEDAKSILLMAEFAPVVSSVVHELQKERGRSAGYIGSGLRSDLRTAVVKQRDATTVMTNTFFSAESQFDTAAYDSEFSGVISVARDSLTNLDATRDSIDSGQMAVAEMAGYYTSTISSLLDVIKYMISITRDDEITRTLTAYIGILEAKERAGLERAMGNIGYASGMFPTEIYNRFVGLIEQQNSYLDIFNTFASADAVRFYNSTMKGEPVRNVDAMRHAAFAGNGDVSKSGFSAEFWFDQITQKINLLKDVEDFVNAEILAQSQTLADSSSATFWSLTVASLVMMAAVTLGVLTVQQSISRPLKKLVNSMGVLANGDLEVNVPNADYDSEIGEMAEAVLSFKENGLERRRLQAETKRAEAERKMLDERNREEAEQRQKAEQERELAVAREREERAKAIEELVTAFNKQSEASLTALVNAAQDLSETSTEMNDQAEGNETQSSATASTAEQTTANVHTVAAATEELSSSIGEISRQVAESNTISESAVNQAKEAAAVVDELNQSTEKVGEIVDLIHEIAGQTNLLALNATIEAASAGDAGAGFAVVASEVKALASQTGTATEDIANQVQNIQEISDQVRKAFATMRKVVEQTSSIASSVAAAVEEQGAATSEISRNIQEANIGTKEVSKNIAAVREVAHQTRSSSTRVDQSAKEVALQAQELGNLVEHFIQSVQSVQTGQTLRLVKKKA